MGVCEAVCNMSCKKAVQIVPLHKGFWRLDLLVFSSRYKRHADTAIQQTQEKDCIKQSYKHYIFISTTIFILFKLKYNIWAGKPLLQQCSVDSDSHIFWSCTEDRTCCCGITSPHLDSLPVIRVFHSGSPEPSFV